MSSEEKYPIGEPGVPWREEEKTQWLSKQTIKRSYQQLVVTEMNNIANQNQDVNLINYGNLPYPNNQYPLLLFQSKQWQKNKPLVLVTGGVHGYETSGVHGALAFVKSKLSLYSNAFNFIVAPCISPWGYETINRWNPYAIDPNRSFYEDSPALESTSIMQYLSDNDFKPICHIDLHETTDTDNSEFRPALAARDAIEQKTWNIPDGFYTVADSTRPQKPFQEAIIKSVQKVTHIAPADENNQLIGETIEQFGVINYDCKKLNLCAGMTDAQYVTTTEVYPDSPLVNDQNCIDAQIAALVGGLDYLLTQVIN